MYKCNDTRILLLRGRVAWALRKEMNLFSLLLFTFSLCFLAEARKGRKIAFSTEVEIQYDNYNTEPLAGTEEYYNDYRWVAVTSDGYETEGTLEEAKALLSSMKEEDKEYNDDPVTHPPPFSEQAEPVPTTPKYTPYERDVFKRLAKRRVFKPDARRKVSPVNRYPYTTIGQLESGCTGTLVARRTVLTAARCLYRRSSGWTSKLNFRLGKDCDPDRGAAVNWTMAVVYRGWMNSEKTRLDVGLVMLSCPSVVFMPFGYTNRKDLRRGRFYTAGYACDKPNQCLWRTTCRITGFSGRGSTQLQHNCDSNRCSTGSPLYMHQRKQMNRRVVYGVNLDAGSRENSNSATRITASHMRTLKRWIRRFGG